MRITRHYDGYNVVSTPPYSKRRGSLQRVYLAGEYDDHAQCYALLRHCGKWVLDAAHEICGLPPDDRTAFMWSRRTPPKTPTPAILRLLQARRGAKWTH